MPIDNIISINFTEEEKKEIDKAVATLDKILSKKMINLTPKEKQKYSRPRESFYNWIQKVLMYIDQAPEMTPPYLDVEELKKDLNNYDLLHGYFLRLLSIQEGLEDTSLLIWKEIYDAGITYFRNVELASQSNVPGSTTVFDDLKGIFKKQGKRNMVDGKYDESSDGERGKDKIQDGAVE
jgi:hypothetical protein